MLDGRSDGGNQVGQATGGHHGTGAQFGPEALDHAVYLPGKAIHRTRLEGLHSGATDHAGGLH